MIGGILMVVLVAGLVPGVFAGNMAMGPRLVCAAGVGLFGVLFVAVAARIVGIVGVSSQPTSGVALVTLLGTASVFAAAGWLQPGARAAVLTVGTIVAVAASPHPATGAPAADLTHGLGAVARTWLQDERDRATSDGARAVWESALELLASVAA